MSCRILIASDKFKGAFTASEACQAIGRGVHRLAGDLGIAITVVEAPVADGGEGTAETLCAALGGEMRAVRVHDPLGRCVDAAFGLAPARAHGDEGQIAVMEMSMASGLWRLTQAEFDPWKATTYGTGEMMRAAVKKGATTLIVGIGGSATNDGGSGMARALGVKFLDRNGREIVKLPEQLLDVVAIDLSQRQALPEVIVACDVTNPLLGERGATAIYGPQKGVTPARLAAHEERLAHFAEVVERTVGVSAIHATAPAMQSGAAHCGERLRDVPGAGAAGGLGFGLLAFAQARLEPGFAIVEEALGLRAAVAEADIVLTGEGGLDAQTGQGKGPAGVAELARALGKPVVGFAGRVERSAEADQVLGALFDAVVEIRPAGWSVEQCIAAGSQVLEDAVAADPHLRSLLSGDSVEDSL